MIFSCYDVLLSCSSTQGIYYNVYEPIILAHVWIIDFYDLISII